MSGAPSARDPAIAALIEEMTALLTTGPSEAARARLAAEAGCHPDDGLLALRHGDALHLAGRLEEAAAEYRRAVALDAGLFDAWDGLGCAARCGASSTRATGSA